jgi:hypothetical protein
MGFTKIDLFVNVYFVSYFVFVCLEYNNTRYHFKLHTNIDYKPVLFYQKQIH